MKKLFLFLGVSIAFASFAQVKKGTIKSAGSSLLQVKTSYGMVEGTLEKSGVRSFKEFLLQRHP
jgi:hypothetical protein